MWIVLLLHYFKLPWHFLFESLFDDCLLIIVKLFVIYLFEVSYIWIFLNKSNSWQLWFKINFLNHKHLYFYSVPTCVCIGKSVNKIIVFVSKPPKTINYLIKQTAHSHIHINGTIRRKHSGPTWSENSWLGFYYTKRLYMLQSNEGCDLKLNKVGTNFSQNKHVMHTYEIKRVLQEWLLLFLKKEERVLK